MKTIDEVMTIFLKAQEERLSKRTFKDYESVIELFQIYLNGYGYQTLEESDMKLWENRFKDDEASFTKLFGIDKISSYNYSEFFEYFIIRKVASGPTFMKTAVRVMKKLTKWLLENHYIDENRFNILMDFFKGGKDKELLNAEKVGDLLYDYTRNQIDRKYEQILENYFVIEKVENKQLWVTDLFGASESIGPVIVSKQISDLCQQDWEIFLVIGEYKGKWHIIESGNVSP